MAVCPGYARLPHPFYGLFEEDFVAGSYGYNGDETGLVRGPGVGLLHMERCVSPDPRVKESDVVSPSGMIAIGDALLSVNAASQIPTPSSQRWTTGNYELNPDIANGVGGVQLMLGLVSGPYLNSTLVNDLPLIKRRHGGRFNVLFCDGHVEGLAVGRLFDYRQPQVRRLWYCDNQPHEP